jgi:short-subunit dehydrogenase
MQSPRTILITGASSGIGAALALAYAAPTITLLLTARDETRLNDVAQQCRTRGATVHTASIDVCDKPVLAAWIERMDDATPIDTVIANAGISTGSFSGEETPDAAEQVFAVNVGGVIHTIHPIIPRMVARGGGAIAIMSSLAGICPLPSAPAYSASKAAVRYYGEALHAALKPRGVHVCVICPGWITTPLTDKNDFPMPWIMPSHRAAGHIIRNLGKKKSRIAFPWQLYALVTFAGIFPHFMRAALLARMSKKRWKS